MRWHFFGGGGLFGETRPEIFEFQVDTDDIRLVYTIPSGQDDFVDVTRLALCDFRTLNVQRDQTIVFTGKNLNSRTLGCWKTLSIYKVHKFYHTPFAGTWPGQASYRRATGFYIIQEPYVRCVTRVSVARTSKSIPEANGSRSHEVSDGRPPGIVRAAGDLPFRSIPSIPMQDDIRIKYFVRLSSEDAGYYYDHSVVRKPLFTFFTKRFERIKQEKKPENLITTLL